MVESKPEVPIAHLQDSFKEELSVCEDEFFCINSQQQQNDPFYKGIFDYELGKTLKEDANMKCKKAKTKGSG